MTDFAVHDVVYRPASHSDCEAIAAIDRNVYNGLDCFYHIFHDRITDPTSFPYVCEINNSVVAYCCARIIDDGETMIFEFARVQEAFGQNGVMSKGKMVVVSVVKKRYPNLKRIVWTSDNLTEINAIIQRHARMHMLTRIADVRPQVTFADDMPSLKQLCQSESFKRLLKQYPVDQIQGLAQRESLAVLSRWQYHQNDLLMVSFQPFTTSSTSLKKMPRSTRLHVNRSPEDQGVSAFSLGTVVTTHNGTLRYMVDFYCRQPEKSSPDTTGMALSHLLYHLREVTDTEASEGSICFSFFFPRQLSKSELKIVLLDHLGLGPEETSEDDGLVVCSYLNYAHDNEA